MSKQEKLFDSLVSKLICKKVPFPEEKEKRLLTFFNQKEYYYDIFCESIYRLMTTNNINTISLDNFGYTRFDAISNDNILGYALLSKEDIISSNDDIIVYVEMALNRLEKRLEAAEQFPPMPQKEYPKIKLL